MTIVISSNDKRNLPKAYKASNMVLNQHRVEDMAAISLHNIKFGYTNTPIFENFDLDVLEGKLTTILGANGAGKTTLIQLMLNQINPQNGSVTVFGEERISSKLKQKMGALQQNATAPEKVKVRELIELFSSYYTNPLPFEQLTDSLGLTPILDKLFSELSGGQKQITLLAIAVCGNPSLLFLDEPSVGMDIELRRKVWGFIGELKRQGKTIILTTHYLEEAEKLSDQVVVIHQGQVIMKGTPMEIKAQTSMKRIQCYSALNEEEVAALPFVANISHAEQRYEVFSEQPETTLRAWLALDQQLSELSVESSSLETAFLHLINNQQQAQ
jgi:ABC-2 type transport system ATP-binding protein